MITQEEHGFLPNTDRLSILVASILLAYALLPFFQIPERSITLQVAGVLFVFRVSFSTIISVLTACLAAIGTDMLLRQHPRLGNQTTFQHWLLPAMTAWVIGVPLSTLRPGLQWGIVFSFSALLLVLVLVAEYVSVDPFDIRFGPAAVGLTAVSYALFLILTITLAAARSRLYILLPALTLAIFLVSLHNLYFRLGGHWSISWSAALALAVGQVAAALHYWPLAPLQFGLVILGLAYSLASVAGSIMEGRSWRTLWIEPAVMLLILWGLAAGLRE